MSDIRHDFAPIKIGEYIATWEPVPSVSHFLGGGVFIRMWWVIRLGEKFVGTAETPGEVQELIRFAQKLPRAA